MLETYKKNVSIDTFLRNGNDLEIKNKSDFISYPEFLNYFQNIQSISKHNLIIGINFTYGWMPTIFDFRSDKFDDAIQILNRAKSGFTPSLNELEQLKQLFNKSLVGTSKLLHFINPEKFAIWDSRVCRYLTKKEPHDYRVGNASSYLDYLTFCKYLIAHEAYEEVHSSIISKIGYEMSKFRTAELIMYSKGKRPK